MPEGSPQIGTTGTPERGEKTTEETRHARREYRCHDCSATIRPGDLYYNRNTDYCILCIPCWDGRKQRWAASRSSPDREDQMLHFLQDAPRTSAELQTKFGSTYVPVVRKLIIKGHPIWRRRVRSNVVYSIGNPVNREGVLPPPARPRVVRRYWDEEDANGAGPGPSKELLKWSERCVRCNTVITLQANERPGRRFCEECIDQELTAILSKSYHTGTDRVS